MKTDQVTKYFLYIRTFKNAKWILTDKKSGEVTECNHSEMSSIVIDAYILWYNNYLAKPPYNEPELKLEDLRARDLHQVGCGIARINKRDIVGVSYSEILPDYTIDCYDWHYQCGHCDAVLDEIREKGQESAKIVFCPHCFEETEYR